MPDDVIRMSKDEVSEYIVQVLQSLYTATKTVVIYPSENPSVVRMVESAFDAVSSLIPLGGSFDLSYIEGKLIVNGEMLDEALQKRGIIQSFQELLKTRRISSLTFWSGLEKDELRRFLVVLGTKAPVVGAEEPLELDEEMEEQDIRHIEVDEQIYVAISKREKVVDARVAVQREEDAALKALKDEVFARFLAGEASQGEVDQATMKEMLTDPDKMVAMVQGVVSSQGWDTDVRTMPFRVDETRAILERVSGLIDQVDNPLVRSKLNREISKITSQIDTPQLTEMLLSSAAQEDAQSAELPRIVLPLLEDKKLTSVVENVVEEYRRVSSAAGADEWPTERMASLRSILDEAAASAEGDLAVRLGDMVDKAGLEKAPEKMAEVSGRELARALESGADISECDRARGPALVGAAEYLFERGLDELGAQVMGRLGDRFRSQSPEARTVAARQIWGLFGMLREMGKEVYAADLVDEVSQVLEQKQSALNTFSSLTKSMGEAAASEALGSALGTAGIEVGAGGAVSAQAIEKLMTADTGKVVQAVFASGDEAARDAITKVLLGMEDRAVPALIDTALQSRDDEEIGSVANSLRQLQTDPIPQIAARMSSGLDSWQMVNLVKLIALVGDESSVSILNQLLLGDDLVVRAQVIKALGALGGKHSLQMVVSESADIDPVLRAAAVRELGNFRDYLAVRRLIEVIAPKKKGEPLEDEQVMIAACRSIGQLRVRQAVQALADIARGGKRKDYSEGLRASATVALGMVGGDEARGVLKQLLKDQSMLVRSSARKALGG